MAYEKNPVIWQNPVFEDVKKAIHGFEKVTLAIQVGFFLFPKRETVKRMSEKMHIKNSDGAWFMQTKHRKG